MRLSMQLGKGSERTIKKLGTMGREVLKAVHAGLDEGAKDAAGYIVSNYLSGQALKRRTGNLAKAVDGWMAGDLHAVIGVRSDSPVGKYAWLLTDEQKTIRPKNSKFLAIPIGENLTGAGVARFTSPRQVPNGFFVSTGNSLLFGYKRGKRGKFRALFTLKKSVFVQGSGALVDGVLDKVDDINDSIDNRINQATGGK